MAFLLIPLLSQKLLLLTRPYDNNCWNNSTTTVIASPPGASGTEVTADTGIITLSAAGAAPSTSIANHSSLGSEIIGIETVVKHSFGSCWCF